MLLPDAEDIERWADSVLAPTELPRLVRRLIVCTTDPSTLRMGAGKAVRYPGWDGEIEVARGNAWVPDGHSSWELSTGRAGRKAGENYNKRTKEQDDDERNASVFVFVTPRRWPQVKDWLKRKRALGEWRGVEVLTADELDTWLDKVPHVALWLSELINGRIHGARSLESWWNQWRELSHPYPISAQLVLAGRATQAEQVREWLGGDPAKHAFQADSVDEGVAFITAALLPDDFDRDVRFASAVVVHDENTWNEIVTAPPPLILIPTFTEPWVTEAVRRGHHVLIPAVPDEPVVSEIQLPQIPIDEARRALIEMTVPEDRAEILAKEARGGLLPLRRNLASGSFRRPEWATDQAAHNLVPALLATSWDSAQSGDRDVLAHLGERDYGELESEFDRWSTASDPPLRQRGTVWVLSAKRDAWTQLRSLVTRRQWTLFEGTVVQTLGAADPAWDLPPSERWMAGVKGKDRPHSDRLRHGLAESLAVVGSEPDLQLPGGGRGQDLATRVVRTLLEQVNEEPSVAGWASVGDLLPALAEAAPEAFLDAVQQGASGDDPVLAHLMADEGDGGSIFSRAYHAGLLWALEALSWSPEHLGRVARILARLATIDPGGRWSNRPENSFIEIFLPIRPQNTASAEQRVRILESVRRAEPAAAWSLFVKLLDRVGAVSAIARPRWRPWPTVRLDSAVVWGDWLSMSEPILNWLVEDANKDGRRWAQLVRILPELPRGDVVERLADQVLAGLESLRPSDLDPDGSKALLTQLRDTVGAHRTHATQAWAMGPERVDRLAAVMAALEPTDPVASKAWLFANHPDLDLFIGNDYNRYDEVWEQLMGEALAEVFGELGWDGVERLVASVDNAYLVGFALGQKEDVTPDQLRHWFESDEERLRRAADGFVRGRTRAVGQKWLESFAQEQAGSWQARAIGRALAVGAPNPDGWSLANALGPEIDAAYWERFGEIGLHEDAWAAAPLLRSHGRPHDAVEVLGYALRDKDGTFVPDEVYEALLAASQVPFPRHIDVGMFQYHLVRLLNRLDQVGFDRDKIAQLEWRYLQLLERGERRTALLLHRELAENPEFFVTVVSALYRAHGDPPRELDEGEAGVARQAFELLSSWESPPGLGEQGFDPNRFREWVADARNRLAEARRMEVGDTEIGKVLWYLPPGTDGYKPPEAVRDFLEEVKSDHLGSGFHTGAINSQGVTTRSPTTGGEPEHELAAEYRAVAEALADRWDRIARVYRALAQSFEAMAQRWDQEALLNADEY